MRFVLLLCVACGTSNSGSDGGSPDGTAPDGSSDTDGGGGSDSGGGTGIAAKYPCDMGIDKDPDVVFVENFEEGSVSALTMRYEDKKPGGITLANDVPPK